MPYHGLRCDEQAAGVVMQSWRQFLGSMWIPAVAALGVAYLD